MKTDLFQSCSHSWVFQIYWHIECSTFTASSFRIWNSSAGIPSPPLALFRAMLLKAHLPSHSRISGSRWVITPSWLSQLWRSFLYISMYFCMDFPHSSVAKESACNSGDLGSIPGLGRCPGEGSGNPLPSSWPGKSRGPRSLVGYSPWGCKELDTTKQLDFHFLFSYSPGQLWGWQENSPLLGTRKTRKLLPVGPLMIYFVVIRGILGLELTWPACVLNCIRLCDPHGLWPSRLSSWNFPGKNPGVSCHFLLHGNFPTQGLNARLLHCRWILCCCTTWETSGLTYQVPK